MGRGRLGYGVMLAMLLLQGCGVNVATECYQIQNALIEGQPSFASTHRAAYLAQAEAYWALAESLAAQPLKDEALMAHRLRLVETYQQLGQLTQAETALMEPDGSVIIASATTEADYDQLRQQLRAIQDAVEAERSALRLYCSLQ